MTHEPYLRLLETVSPDDVEFGAGGIGLYSADALDEAQVGYGVHPDGTPQTGAGDGDWRPSWRVIAQDLLCGDPVFIDTAVAEMPVFTAAHGVGRWDPVRIADSSPAFFGALDVVRRVAVGREHPVALEENPLPEAERSAALREIAELSPGSDPSFWETLLTFEV
jgi:hypothetical protein